MRNVLDVAICFSTTSRSQKLNQIGAHGPLPRCLCVAYLLREAQGEAQEESQRDERPVKFSPPEHAWSFSPVPAQVL